MPTSLIVADDFLDNPMQLREAALKLDYPEDSDSAYPGRNSTQRINVNGLTEQVGRMVGESLVPLAPQEAHGRFRITLAGDRGQAGVHIDRAHWSGILYLSRDEDCQGGTEFFRHRRTGTDRAPYKPGEAEALGYPSPKAAIDDILDHDSLAMDKWEMSMRVPMRFNRLVLLRPWYWHTAGPAFGDTLENGRLVYLMFWAAR